MVNHKRTERTKQKQHSQDNFLYRTGPVFNSLNGTSHPLKIDHLHRYLIHYTSTSCLSFCCWSCWIRASPPSEVEVETADELDTKLLRAGELSTLGLGEGAAF